MTSDLELIRIHVETLFTHDAGGRLACLNEPSAELAPRFYLGRTAMGGEWRFRHDLDDESMHALESECMNELRGDLFVDSPHGSTNYERVLARSAPIQKKWAGPAYRFPRDLATTASTVLITEANEDILRPHLADWLDSVANCQPFLACMSAGRAVSVCCSGRTTPTAHEAAVETAAEFRGRGYAAQVVSAWARAVREHDRLPLYSTSWENTASRALAAGLGLILYGTDLHIT
ncbi:MAG: GNAT family N-acetyltransferase [Longimicrobiales bacterium]